MFLKSYYMGQRFFLPLLLKGKFECPTHREAKQYQNMRVWNRERFTEGHARRWVVHTLKIPNSLKTFIKVLF